MVDVSTQQKRKKIVASVAISFASLLVLYALYYLAWGKYQEFTDDAYVAGNQVQLMPQVSGTVVSINADDTQLVHQGQQLVLLDPADKLVALQQARANLATTVRQVRQYYEAVKKAEAALVLRKADLENAQLDLQRRQGLVKVSAISKENMQHVATAAATAEARYQLAQHELAATKALVENSHLYEHPLVEKAKAAFRNAYLNMARTTVYAPITGYVAKRNVQLGQQVTSGSSLLTIIPLNHVWVEANYKESQLNRLRIGQAVDVVADVNGVTYHGTVLGLSAGTGSAFSLLPAQNATGNWIKIVQRLPVRIALNAEELNKHPLQIGLSVRVTTHTRGLDGNELATTTKNTAIYSTNIYQDQLARAEKEINTILRENAADMDLKS